MSRKIIIFASLIAIAFPASAVQVVITQTLSDVIWSDYGVTTGLGYGQEVTGDWIFKGTTDTELQDEAVWTNYGSFFTTVTLTQESLGVYDEVITNLNYLFVGSDIIGFSVDTYGRAPFTITRMSENYFSTPDIFPSVPEITINDHFDSGNGFGPQWAGFQLESGDNIYGFAYSGISSVSAQYSSVVPLPGAFILFASALVALSQIKFTRSHKGIKL